MGERAALAPDLSRLALHETRAVGMEQDQPAGSDARVAGSWNGIGSVSSSREMEKLINQFYGHISMEFDLQEPDSLLYDQALQLLGLYRDCNNWAEFTQWTLDKIPNYQNTAHYYTNPRVYFKRCCLEFKIRVLAYKDDLKAAQKGLINQHVINRPWIRAFHAYLIQRDPSLFKNLRRDDAVLNPNYPYQKADYMYYAKVALARDGGMLEFTPGALRQPPDSTKVWPGYGFTDAEFVELAKIAINSKEFVSGEKDVEIFSRVPPDLRAQLFSAEQIAQLQERFVNMAVPMDA